MWRAGTVAGLLLASLAAVAKEPDHQARVRAFIAAFNAQDVEALVAQVSDDIEWLSVDGRSVGTEASDKSVLRAQMADYFQGCPSCRSELGAMVVSGIRLATVETATWTGQDGRRQAQRSLAVYEFAGDGRIRRVHYFPVEP